MAAQFGDNNGTWIKTNRYQSEFTWEHDSFSNILVHPSSRIPTLQVNPGYSTFTSFYTFLENAGLVPRTQDAVFLCGAILSDTDDEDPTMPNYLPAPLPVDGADTTKTKPTFSIGQNLQLTRDGYGEQVILDSVDVDMDTMVPYYSVRL